MNGLDKINSRIAGDARAEIDAIAAQGREAAADVVENYRRQAAQLSEEADEKRRQATEDRLARLSGSADMERRQMLLSTKQECIDRAFDAAAQKLRAMPQEEYIALLAKIAAVNGSGDEEIVLDPADSDIGQQVVAQANAAKPGASFTLSSEQREFGGGLVLKRGSVECNCSFAAQLGSLRQDMAAEVARVLFH